MKRWENFIIERRESTWEIDIYAFIVESRGTAPQCSLFETTIIIALLVKLSIKQVIYVDCPSAVASTGALSSRIQRVDPHDRSCTHLPSTSQRCWFTSLPHSDIRSFSLSLFLSPFHILETILMQISHTLYRKISQFTLFFYYLHF